MLWHPQTTATLDRRLGSLDTVRQREPEIAWRLLTALLPRFQDVAHPTHAPRRREWKPEEESGVTHAEWDRAIREIVRRLLADVGVAGRRWADLIEGVNALPGDMQDAVIERLLAADPAAFNESDHADLREKLRAVVSHHRRFPDAGWAMPPARVDRLAEVYRRFEPDDPIRRIVWLFSNHPALPDIDSLDPLDYRRAIDEARDRAARATYEDGGSQALLDLAVSVEQPGELGWVIGRGSLLGPEEGDIFADLASPRAARRLFARGYVGGRFKAAGWAWAETILQGEASAWMAAQRADFLVGLPSSHRTWDWTEQFDDETERAYWVAFGVFGLEEQDGYARAAAKLVEHRRPYAAVDLLGLYANQAATAEPDLVARALESAARTPVDGATMNGLAHDVAEILDRLEGSGAIDDARMAWLEWAYLPLLRHGRRPALFLHRALAQDPTFFAEVVSWVYRAHDEEQRESTEEESTRAILGGSSSSRVIRSRVRASTTRSRRASIWRRRSSTLMLRARSTSPSRE